MGAFAYDIIFSCEGAIVQYGFAYTILVL